MNEIKISNTAGTPLNPKQPGQRKRRKETHEKAAA